MEKVNRVCGECGSGYPGWDMCPMSDDGEGPHRWVVREAITPAGMRERLDIATAHHDDKIRQEG